MSSSSSHCASNQAARFAMRRQSSVRTSCSRRTTTTPLKKETAVSSSSSSQTEERRGRRRKVTTQALVPGPDDSSVKRAPRPEYIPGKIEDQSYVRVFDTTLRDGEQSPGATLTSTEKVQIATNLAKLGVDIIEAGFPIASPDDLEAVRNIALSLIHI